MTPQATLAVVDYEVPGLAEAMRAAGRRRRRWPTSAAPSSASGPGSLIVNLPGSPKGALESLEAIVPVLDHALETLAGPFDHAARRRALRRAGGGDPAGDPRGRDRARRARTLTFPVFADVPFYPLVFPLFWGAAVVFVLAMARHLRVFAATTPATDAARAVRPDRRAARRA